MTNQWITKPHFLFSAVLAIFLAFQALWQARAAAESHPSLTMATADPSPTPAPSPSPAPAAASPVEMWVARYNGSLNDYARSMAVDALGNVYVTGESSSGGQNGNYDYATIKYDVYGAQLWAARYNGPGNGNDYAQGVVVDWSGNVYVTGYSDGASAGYDYATIKYATSATLALGFPGDVNRDGTVNSTDLTLLTDSFSKRSGETGFNPNADSNGDGIIDILDLVKLGLNFGRSAPMPTPTPTPVPTPTFFPTISPTPSPPTAIDGAALYIANNCALCHGLSRGGGLGPPLTSAALSSVTLQEVASTITNGKNTMPSFAGTMTTAQINALANWLKTTP